MRFEILARDEEQLTTAGTGARCARETRWRVPEDQRRAFLSAVPAACARAGSGLVAASALLLVVSAALAVRSSPDDRPAVPIPAHGADVLEFLDVKAFPRYDKEPNCYCGRDAKIGTTHRGVGHEICHQLCEKDKNCVAFEMYKGGSDCTLRPHCPDPRNSEIGTYVVLFAHRNWNKSQYPEEMCKHHEQEQPETWPGGPQTRPGGPQTRPGGPQTQPGGPEMPHGGGEASIAEKTTISTTTEDWHLDAAHWSRVFKWLDKNNDGVMEHWELIDYVKLWDPAMRLRLAIGRWPDFSNAADTNDDGNVSQAEFQEHYGDRDLSAEECYSALFEGIDVDHSEKLSLDELRKYQRYMNPDIFTVLGAADAQSLLDVMDLESDNEASREEFLKYCLDMPHSREVLLFPDEDPEVTSHWRRVFSWLDQNEDGVMEHWELLNYVKLRDPAMRLRLGIGRWPDFVHVVDSDGDGNVTLREFQDHFTGAVRSPENCFSALFDAIDADRNGKFASDELRKYRSLMNPSILEVLDAPDVDTLVKTVDYDDNGQVSREEFLKYCLGLPRKDEMLHFADEALTSTSNPSGPSGPSGVGPSNTGPTTWGYDYGFDDGGPIALLPAPPWGGDHVLQSEGCEQAFEMLWSQSCNLDPFLARFTRTCEGDPIQDWKAACHSWFGALPSSHPTQLEDCLEVPESAAEAQAEGWNGLANSAEEARFCFSCSSLTCVIPAYYSGPKLSFYDVWPAPASTTTPQPGLPPTGRWPPDGSPQHCRPTHQGQVVGQQQRRRREVHLWSDEEWTKFYAAVNHMKLNGNYSTFVQDYSRRLKPGEPEFSVLQSLPWNRRFLLDFETTLQVVSGDCDLTLPFWSVTLEASPAALVSSSVLGPDRLGGRPSCSDGSASCENPAAGGAARRCAGDPRRWCLGDGLAAGWQHDEVNGCQCVHRSPRSSASLITHPVLFKLLANASDLLSISKQLGAFTAALHCGVTGEASTLCMPDVAPWDPLFFLLHTNVDRLFLEWQRYRSAKHDTDTSTCLGCESQFMTLYGQSLSEMLGTPEPGPDGCVALPKSQPGFCVSYDESYKPSDWL